MSEQTAIQLGIECLKSGRIDEAIQHLEAATAASPDDYKALDFLGVAYAQKGLYSRAVGTLQVAMKLHPMSASIHYNLGQAYRADGIYDKALEHYQQALKIDPMYIKATNAIKLIPSAASALVDQSCARHIGEPAVDKCSNCHLMLCTECKTLKNNKVYCPKCAEKVIAE